MSLTSTAFPTSPVRRAIRSFVPLALAAVAGCGDGVNQRYFCDLEDIGLGAVCLAHEDKHLAHEACKHVCEQAQEAAPDGAGINDYDCNDVETDNVTHTFTDVCAINVDWPAVLSDDPDSGLAHAYACSTPWVTGQYVCEVDGIQTVKLLAKTYHGCGHNDAEGHQSCIDACTADVEAANALLEELDADCGFAPQVCEGLNYPYELEGQVCDTSTGMMVDRAGDHLEQLAWSTADGGAERRALSCSLADDCCELYGAGACNNVKRQVVDVRIADHTTALTGTITLVRPDAAPVTANARATISSSARTCHSASGICPMYIESVAVDAAGSLGRFQMGGETYEVSDLSLRLEAPALGGADMGRRSFVLAGDRLAVQMTADVAVPSRGSSKRVAQPAPMPAAITGRLTSRGAISELSATLPLDGPDTRIELVLHAPQHGGAK